MSRVAWLFKQMSAAAVCGLAALAVSAAAHADPCVQECRGQHNACRMTTKMLSSPGCDAQLQSCITRCFHRGGPSMGREPPGREHLAVRHLADHHLAVNHRAMTAAAAKRNFVTRARHWLRPILRATIRACENA